jgi:hypothetical protein
MGESFRMLSATVETVPEWLKDGMEEKFEALQIKTETGLFAQSVI